MQPLDWIVIGVYLAGLLAMALVIGRRQASSTDYFLGGRQLSAPMLAASTLATNCLPPCLRHRPWPPNAPPTAC